MLTYSLKFILKILNLNQKDGFEILKHNEKLIQLLKLGLVDSMHMVTQQKIK